MCLLLFVQMYVCAFFGAKLLGSAARDYQKMVAPRLA
jgi:hypothetical protein